MIIRVVEADYLDAVRGDYRPETGPGRPSALTRHYVKPGPEAIEVLAPRRRTH
ncbi:hypothetical protein [Nonomuraea sp. NPDC002799]